MPRESHTEQRPALRALLRWLLLLLFLHEGLHPACGHSGATRASFLVPRSRESGPAAGCSRTASSNRSRSNTSRSAASYLTGPEDDKSDCPRCVWLNHRVESPPIVVGWEEASGNSRESDACCVPLNLGMARAANAAFQLRRNTTKVPVLDVVPVEVEVAPETRLALELPPCSHKRHIFLPLCLLGFPRDLQSKTNPYLQCQVEKPTENCAPVRSGEIHEVSANCSPLSSVSSSAQQPFLEALKESVCKALKWGGNLYEGIPMQLAARVTAPKKAQLAPHSPIEESNKSAGLSANSRESSGLEQCPFPTVWPLSSDREAQRVLRKHYKPLLDLYRRLPHSASCASAWKRASDNPKNNDVGSRNCSSNVGAQWITALRILRLPRGAQLSLQLQLEPPLPSFPFSSDKSVPLPPPVVNMSAWQAHAHSNQDASSPYQLVSLYKFFRVSSPRALAELLRALWGPRGVLGRAYVAEEGINAQLAVPSSVFASIITELQQIPGLEDGLQVTPDCLIPFYKYWSSPPFDTLHIRPRHQVLRDGFDCPLDWSDCGEEVEPEVWHRKLVALLQEQQLQKQRTPKVVLLDMRNASEYAVGHFKGSQCVDTLTFADSFTSGGPLEEALARVGIQLPSREATSVSSKGSCSRKDVEIMMYCTGGIRCVKAGAFVKQILGFPRVTRLKGGILAYKNFIESFKKRPNRGEGILLGAEEEGSYASENLTAANANECATDEGGLSGNETLQQRGVSDPSDAAVVGLHDPAPESLFVGSNYVFDHRMCQQITPDLLTHCTICSGPSGRLVNCSNRRCGRRVVLCSSCCSSIGVFCSSACAREGAEDGKREVHAQTQRRMQVRHTYQKLLQQRRLWAMRAQQLLAALKYTAAADSVSGQETLLEEGRRRAKDLTGLQHEVQQFWSGPLHSRILSAISKLKRPRSILEIGAFVGISTLALAEGLVCEEEGEDGCFGILAIEKDPRAATAARRLVSSSPWGRFITLMEVDAMQWLQSLPKVLKSPPVWGNASESTRYEETSSSRLPNGGFDLIYLDAEKKRYLEYISAILNPQRPLLALTGVLVIDNTLWLKGQDGKRIAWWENHLTQGESARARRYAKVAECMQTLRETLRNDARISHVLLPVGDGLSLVTWANQPPPPGP
ncbi:hypothetical protein, conserved [Eimeria tenella]|uniref:Rhodanese domain-containing protein n=1 Tax=Eimeria tenella TaxID=5802 RepID=U6L5A9_EIMTE|nr:hypothetical protein, conserved [Eimeria tenella]CDJ42935.1 hypothetical protein, conserved [Eimeria tenella]|eukprot:XP_013233685.1 hypothetical protein, conserved [Eimeria tenella]